MRGRRQSSGTKFTYGADASFGTRSERGVVVDHSTIHMWVVRYSPDLEAEFRRGKRPVGRSWQVDETYIKVKGTWKYLNRAVDRNGKTVDFLLTAKCDTIAAYRFFLKALDSSGVPEKLTMDKSGLNKAAVDLFVEDLSSQGGSLEIRQVKYLNNIVEQDHRGVKRRTGPMLGLKSFLSAQRTNAGIELVHMLRKRQHEASLEMSPADVFYSLAG